MFAKLLANGNVETRDRKGAVREVVPASMGYPIFVRWIKDEPPPEIPVGVHTFNDLCEIQVRGTCKKAEKAMVRPTCGLPVFT